ncbi:ribosome biogenesis protein BRX1 [Nematocida sp. LUAm3]|nr:ribosome biogenesis protein BRX1 [Nematocida sp. LUAm3]KAI5175847.1 ribosome biogenesis protein BRX1 [Nematocida sp. LUAm2]KAI5178343.1 ribosome biogenesis protein BRX1 [Nematocida sp. LUAm1]
METEIATHAQEKIQEKEHVEETHIEEQNYHTRKTLLLLSMKCPMGNRLLLNDLEKLMPEHVVRDTKMKEKFSLDEVADLADMKDADNVFLIETRKKTPAPILWAVTKEKTGNTKKEQYDIMKFMMTGIYSMRELKFTGNPLSNSQMLTFFSKEFDQSAGMRRAKAILTKIFNTTKSTTGAPEKPSDYTDKIAGFFLKEKQILVRFYHIAKKTHETEKILQERLRAEELKKEEKKEENPEEEEKAEEEEQEEELTTVLNEQMKPWYQVTEVGPRFTLHPRESDLDDNYKELEEKERQRIEEELQKEKEAENQEEAK